MTGKYSKAALLGLLERAVWTFIQTFIGLIPVTASAFGQIDWTLGVNAAGIAALLSAGKSALSILGDGNVSTVPAEVVVPDPL